MRYLVRIGLAVVAVIFIAAVSLSAAGVAPSAMPQYVCDCLVMACAHVEHVLSVAHSWVLDSLFG